jgi:hypothetical protein
MKQGQLFDPRRFSPLRLSVWLQVPKSMARTLAIASALGRGIRSDSTFAPFRDGKDIIGVHIGPTQRKTIVKVAAITNRYWWMLVESWTSRHIAHKCGPGHVTLLLDYMQSPCPNPTCKADLEVKDYFTSERSVTSPPSEGLLHQNVTNSGDETRDERGDEVLGSQGSDRALGQNEVTEAQVGVLEIRATSNSICRCGHEISLHFAGGSCRVPTCRCPATTLERPR